MIKTVIEQKLLQNPALPEEPQVEQCQEHARMWKRKEEQDRLNADYTKGVVVAD